MKPAHIGQLFAVLVSASFLAAGLGGASLLVQISLSDVSARYPLAERLSQTRFRMDFLPAIYINQVNNYQTTDTAAQVLSWYAQRHGFPQAESAGDMGPCRTFARQDGRLIFRYVIAVTLCARPTGTLIYVNRSLVLR